ncbi:MAG: flavodoxin domain-containing protein [Anaerovoracaceae bacterium]|jgi:flavodoxin
MKKIAVVYGTKHGSAKRYARYIAEKTGADLFDYEKTKAKQMAPYDIIVFGGGIYSGGIRGIDFLRKNIKKRFAGKKIICFAVGISVDTQANREQCNEINFDKHMQGIECYYFPGAYDPKSVSGLDRQLMKVTRKMIEGGGSTDDGQKLLYYIDHGCDLVDISRADPLIHEVRALAQDDSGDSAAGSGEAESSDDGDDRE